MLSKVARPEAHPQDSPSIGVWLALVSVAVASAIVVEAFEWSLLDRMPGLVFMPLHHLVAAAALVVAFAIAIAALFKIPRRGWRFALPLAVAVAGLILGWLAPFTDWWLAANFRLGLAERQRIVAMVRDGTLRPNVEYNNELIALGYSHPHVSAGGNDIVVRGGEARPYVLFFTFRGVINHFSGFLYVPPGGSPAEYIELGADRGRQVVHWEGPWYFIAQ